MGKGQGRQVQKEGKTSQQPPKKGARSFSSLPVASGPVSQEQFSVSQCKPFINYPSFPPRADDLSPQQSRNGAGGNICWLKEPEWEQEPGTGREERIWKKPELDCPGELMLQPSN